MKLTFDDVLFNDIVENCLVSAGKLGKKLLASVDWRSCDYDLLEIAGVSVYPSDRYDQHVIPHNGGSGTFESPDNYAAMATRIKENGLSLVTRDFVLEKPHRLMPFGRSISMEDGIYYFYDSALDDEDQLMKVIRLARSWTFLGITCAAMDLEKVRSGKTEALIDAVHSLFLPAYAGDTFVEVSACMAN